MNDTWINFALGEVCSLITDGSHFSPATSEEGYPYVTVRDVREGRIDLEGALRIPKDSFEELSRNGCQPRRGDVLFSKDGTVGRVALVVSDDPFVVLSSLAILRPDANRVIPDFLSYALQAPNFQAEATGQKTGLAIKRVVLKNLKQMTIPVPPLAVQRRIVDLIAHLDTHLTNLRAEVTAGLELERRLIEGLLADQVDVEEATLGELGEFIRGRRFVKADYVPEGLGCIHYGQVHTHFGPVATEVLTYLPEEMATRLRFARHGDIVIAATSEDFEGLGKATVWMGEAEVAVHDDCYIYRHDLDPVFAAYVVASPWFQRQKGQFGDGTKVTRISSTDLARIRVPIPKREAQIRIGETLSALSSQNTLLREEMTSLGLIRRSLLSGLMSQTVQIPLAYDAILDRAA